MSKDKAFIQYFNDLHLEMCRILGNDNLTFYECLQIMRDSQKSNIVQSRYKELDVIRQLRNIMTHETTSFMQEIAQPSDQLIHILKDTLHKLKFPIKVAQYIEQMNKQEVATIFQEATLYDILHLIKQKHYSQFPVFNREGFIGLLTDNGLTNWLAQTLTREGHWENQDAHQISIAELLSFDEKKDTIKIVSKETNLYDVISLFQEETKHSVVLVSKHYHKTLKSPEDLYGVLTSRDLPHMYELLD